MRGTFHHCPFWRPIYLFDLVCQAAYKADTEQIIHQYTMTKDEPLFRQAKANAELLSNVSKLNENTVAWPCSLCDYIGSTSYFVLTFYDVHTYFLFSRKCTRATGRSRGKRVLSCIWTLCLSSLLKPRETWPVMWVEFFCGYEQIYFTMTPLMPFLTAGQIQGTVWEKQRQGDRHQIGQWWLSDGSLSTGHQTPEWPLLQEELWGH